ncbi:MAG: hypothetical protein ACKPJO_21510 [Dolichospermum sp.]
MLAGSLQSLVSGEAGKQLEQGAKQFISNPIGAISNFLGVNKNKILSPIQEQQLRIYLDISRHQHRDFMEYEAAGRDNTEKLILIQELRRVKARK